MNPTQLAIFGSFRKGLDCCVQIYPVRHEAAAIRTPFRDFAGDFLEIYVTREGKVTDGGGTLNLFHSLRCYQDYLDYPFRADFLSRYNINEEFGEMVCTDLSPCGILLYAQGLSKLQGMFEAHPYGEEA